MFDKYVNLFKYESDPILLIIPKVKNTFLFDFLNNLLLSLGITIHEKAYNIIKTVSYGKHHPGKKYQLKNGEKTDFNYDIGVWNSIGISVHIDFYKAVNILTKIW